MVPSSPPDDGFIFLQHLNVGYREFESGVEVILLAGRRVQQLPAVKGGLGQVASMEANEG